jgi:hypothetical protein
MKQIMIIGLPFLLISCAFAQGKSGTLTGEIMDKQCAQMGSHENMMKAQGAKDAKECTLACVKNGDKFALFDSATKKVYLIDSDKKVREYAGKRVQITGTYDDDAGTLQVKSIAPAQ